MDIDEPFLIFESNKYFDKWDEAHIEKLPKLL
jgi:hypothetical protein